MALAGIPDLPELSFQHDGNRKLKVYGGGGGGPNTTYSQTSNIPEYMEPYATKMLAAAEGQVYQGDSFRPFQSYSSFDKARGGTGETVAGFTPTQTQAMNTIQNYQLPGQTGAASQMAGYAGLGSMNAGQQYAQQATNPFATQAYMSPYIQNALAPQMREASRQSAMMGQQNQAQAVQQGAFGGARSGIVEAERQRNLAQQQEDIYGKGMQNAFQAAQQAQQFGADLGIKGYGQGIQAAGQMGALGQQQFGQEMNVLGQQQAVGAQQQQYEQQRMNQIIQDYATSQQYPFMQLGVLNSMLRGLPMQASSTSMYQAQPSGLSQVAGGLGTGLGLVEQYNKAFPTGKEGGVVKMATGGITSGVPAGKLPSMLEKLSDDQLGKKDTAQDMDPLTRDMVDTEQARRSRLRGLASGGVVAFKDGEEVKAKPVDMDTEAPYVRSRIQNERQIELAKQEAEGDAASNINLQAAKQKRITPAPVEAAKPAGIATDRLPAKGTAQTELANQQRITQAPTEPAAELPVASIGSQDTGINKGNAILAKLPAQEAEQSSGIAAKPTETKDGTVELMEAQAAALLPAVNKSVEQSLKEQEAEYKKLGIVNPAIAEQAGLASRKATIESDAQEMAKSRLIQFLVDWGKTPGSALKGAIAAGSNLIEGSVEDRKLRRKMLNELDAVDRDINKAEYLRKVGDVDKAKATQRDAGTRYFNINKELLEYKAKLEVQALKNEIAQLKGAAQNGVVQQADILYKGMVAAGKPEGDITRAAAIREALSLQPSVTGMAISTGAQRDIAAGKLGVDLTEAEIKAKAAETQRQEATRKQQKDFKDDLDDEMRRRRADIKAKVKADKEAGIDPNDPKSGTSKFKQEIEAGVREDYELIKPVKPAKKVAEPAKGSAATPAQLPDNVPKGSKYGKQTAKGWEVFDATGKLIGHANQ
jgi:hypothetical protein